MIADTPANRKSLTTEIAQAFRKMKFKTGEHKGERVFDVDRERFEPFDQLSLYYQPGGIIGKERYTVRVRSVGLGGTFVSGPHEGLRSEIEQIARTVKRQWEKSRGRGG